jgi:diguanylate cyclase (GGDEF)-like protein
VNKKHQVEIMSIILINRDRFKRVNDEFGHSVGDDFFVRMAALLR